MPLKVEGFPELTEPIDGMKKDKVLGYVRNVLRHVVPKGHEKVSLMFVIFKITIWDCFTITIVAIIFNSVVYECNVEVQSLFCV